MSRSPVSLRFRGFDIEACLKPEAWEGDPSLPGGVRVLGEEVSGLRVLNDLGEDVTQDQGEEFLESARFEIMEYARGRLQE